ncbi:MAG: LexA family transcriptional regulator [Acetobacter sp.]|uniref:LexA family transcriptional regulator n=1 Tax=Acetobacter sp. TaxID=440 RepID=UPI0039EAA364
MSFGDFLRDAMDQHGIQNSEVAARFGISSQAVSQWRSGNTMPSAARIEQVRKYIEERVAAVTRIETATPDLPAAERRIPEDYLPVPTIDIRAGAGGGGIIDGAYLGPPRYFESGFIENELRASPTDLCLLEIEGQSMEPLLRHGDTVLVDRRKSNPSMEGIFVLFDGDGVVCKWVERVHGAEIPTIRLRSENERFSPYEVEADRCRVLGRVVWFARRL